MPKTLQGRVVSDKMAKTVVVEVERAFQHPLYKKVVRKHKRHKAHNETLKLKQGDVVKIRETRPLSKDKHFEVIEKIS